MKKYYIHYRPIFERGEFTGHYEMVVSHNHVTTSITGSYSTIAVEKDTEDMTNLEFNRIKKMVSYITDPCYGVAFSSKNPLDILRHIRSSTSGRGDFK